MNGKRRSSYIFFCDLNSVGNAVFATLIKNRQQYILPRSLKGGVRKGSDRTIVAYTTLHTYAVVNGCSNSRGVALHINPSFV